LGVEVMHELEVEVDQREHRCNSEDEEHILEILQRMSEHDDDVHNQEVGRKDVLRYYGKPERKCFATLALLEVVSEDPGAFKHEEVEAHQENHVRYEDLAVVGAAPVGPVVVDDPLDAFAREYFLILVLFERIYESAAFQAILE